MNQDVRILLDGLSAGYNGQPVVSELNLEVKAGEMHGLFGTNGAGKTTTLLTVAGALKPLGGSLQINGHRHPGSLYKAAKNEGVALLTDDRGIFPPLSVRDNLRLGQGSISVALEFFPELEEHLDRRAGLLSGGQQQMLALGRILSAKPKIILADELSLGLAPLVVKRLMGALREAANQGAAVLLVEQHVPVALAVVDTASVIVRGKIALQENASKLRDKPELIMDLYLSNSD